VRSSRNTAAAMGRWSASHRWIAICLWLSFAVAAVIAGSWAGTDGLTAVEMTNGQSQQAQRILNRAGFDLPSQEVVYLHSATATVADPGFRAAISDTVTMLSRDRRVIDEVTSPLAPQGVGEISADRHSALIRYGMTGQAATAVDRIQPVLEAIANVQLHHPGIEVAPFGDATFSKLYNDKLNKDYAAAETYSFPVTLVILFVVFGAAVAAVLPLLLAGTVVAAAGGIVALVSHAVNVDINGKSVMTLIGIAVGVDYSLFYLRRYREERAAGKPTNAAVEAAAATSGRAVLVSGTAVIIAMSGLFFTRKGVEDGMAQATIIAVAIAVLGSVTVLPALLSLLGDNLDKGRPPFIRRRRATEQGGGVISAVINAVLRHPVVSLLITAIALGAMAAPAFSLRVSSPGLADLSARQLPVLRTYQQIQHDFPASASPAQVVVSAPDVTATQVTDAVAALRRDVASDRADFGPLVTSQANADHSVALLTVGLAGNGTDAQSAHALTMLRTRVIPAAFSSVPDATVAVTGTTALSVDSAAQFTRTAPLVASFVLVFTFLMMLTAFRSVTIAGLTLVLNIASVGAAYGLVVLTFQDGLGAGLLGFTKNGGITSWVPLFMFVILFGISMDYHVFVVSRVREAHDRGLPTREAIRTGVTGSARVVTSAAAVMIAVAGVFGLTPELSMKEAGLGMAAAILIDATIVRAVLLPACMRLLGEANWYLPRWLNWLPAARLTEPVVPGALPASEERVPAADPH
jgi:uncharacterized membrane protein YdfJ with MMPL/SSD domain